MTLCWEISSAKYPGLSLKSTLHVTLETKQPNSLSLHIKSCLSSKFLKMFSLFLRPSWKLLSCSHLHPNLSSDCAHKTPGPFSTFPRLHSCPHEHHHFAHVSVNCSSSESRVLLAPPDFHPLSCTEFQSYSHTLSYLYDIMHLLYQHLYSSAWADITKHHT